MDKHEQSRGIDPVDLLREQYECVEMPDGLRRDLLAKSREVVAARHRVPIPRWAASLAGAAAIVAVAVTVWHAVHQSPVIKSAVKPEQKVVTPRSLRPGIAHGKENALPYVPTPQNRPPAGDRVVKVSPSGKTHLSPAHSAVLGMSAPLVAVISVGQPATDGTGRALSPGDRLAVGATIRTGLGGRITLVTRKGSEVHLDANSELHLASPSVAELLRGRLYCSNRDKEIARIDTPAGHIRLLGTVVDTAIVGRAAAAVTVVEGKVRLSNRYGSALVGTGRRSVLVAFRAPQSGVSVNTYKETAWYHGRGDYQSDFGDIAYTVHRESLITEIWMMQADGSGRHRVRSFVGYADELGPWLPGARWLSINLREDEFAGGHPIRGSRTVLLDAATGQSLPFDLPEGYDPMYKSFAPDPTLMAFCGSYRPPSGSSGDIEGGVWVFDRESNQITRVLQGWIKTPMAWAPDSRHLAVSSGEGYTNSHELLIVDAQTREVRDLGVQGAGASFSPDGSRIAYCGDFKDSRAWYRGVPASGSIFVLDFEPGSRPVRVSRRGDWAVEPRWSPDGTLVAYIASDDRVCVARADGTGSAQIYACQDGRVRRVSWNPAGDALYVSVRDRLGESVLLVAVDGSAVKRLLSSAEEQTSLSRSARQQTDAASAAISKAGRLYDMGDALLIEADLAGRRQSYSAAADIFARLVWDYPLAGLGVDDVLSYADAASRESARPDAEVLRDSCRERIGRLSGAVIDSALAQHRFPSDLHAALGRGSTMEGRLSLSPLLGDDELDRMLQTCPGTGEHGPVPYAYAPPASGSRPRIGDAMIVCPLHPDNSFVWRQSEVERLRWPVTED